MSAVSAMVLVWATLASGQTCVGVIPDLDSAWEDVQEVLETVNYRTVDVYGTDLPVGAHVIHGNAYTLPVTVGDGQSVDTTFVCLRMQTN